jgi:hypothetical protein
LLLVLAVVGASLAGKVLLDALNIPLRIVVGAAAYGAVRGEVLRFCNAEFVADSGDDDDYGLVPAHFFLVSGDNVVDFNSGDWAEMGRHR